MGQIITKIRYLWILLFIVIFFILYSFQNTYASSVSINKTSLYLPTHNTYQLRLRGKHGKITWSSNNSKVASVSKKGRVKAKRKGTCIIAALCHGKKYECWVKVTKLSYYRNNKSKATYKYKDGSKVVLFSGFYRGKGGKARYYAAHIRLKKSSYKKFFLAKANGGRSNGFQSVGSAVKKRNNHAYNAVLAVNGPFNGADDSRWVRLYKKWYGVKYHDYSEIVKGKYYKGKLGSDRVTSCATYSAKTGILAPGIEQKHVTETTTLSSAVKKGIISDTFAGDMGYTLLSEGKITGNKNEKSYRQRTFVGTNGKPGDIWIVVANGQCSKGFRYDRLSRGLNSYGMGAILKKLGCTYGYNLDGGSSSTMYFKGKAVTKNWPGGGRPCYDFLCVGQ